MEEEEDFSYQWTEGGAREERREKGWDWEGIREGPTAGIQNEYIVINKKQKIISILYINKEDCSEKAHQELLHTLKKARLKKIKSKIFF